MIERSGHHGGRMSRRTYFGIPFYGLVSACVVSLGVLLATVAVTRWLSSLGEEWERTHLQQGGQWISRSFADEFSSRRDLMQSLVVKWQRLPADWNTDASEFFQPLVENNNFSRIFVYDVEIPTISYQILPDFHLPLNPEGEALIRVAQRELGEARMAAKDPEQFWILLNPQHVQPTALFASRLDQSRFLIGEYRLTQPFQALAHSHGDLLPAVQLWFESDIVLSAGHPAENGIDMVLEYPLTLDEVPTHYKVVVQPGESERRSLLAALRRLIFAGGLMFSLAFGCLVIAWTRSSKRFISASHKQRLLHDRSPLFYHDLDERLNILDVNQTECAALGYRYDELVGQGLAVLLPYNPDILERLHKPDPDNPSFRTMAQYRTLSGEILEVMLTAIADPTDDGRMRWMMIGQDVTEQTRAQRLTARSQLQVRFLSKVVENLEDGLLVLDQLGRVIYANPAASRLIDPEYRGLLGRTLDRLFHLAPVANPWMEIMSAVRNNTPWQRELALLNEVPDHARISIRLSGESGRETGGSAIILLVRDMTTEKELTRQLASSQQMYQVIFDRAPSGILVLDQEGAIINANDYHRDNLARVLDEFDAPGSLFEHPVLLRAGARDALARLYDGEEITLEEVPFPTIEEGQTRYLTVRGIPMRDANRTGIVRAFFFVEDVTERVELERRRREHTISLEGEKQAALESSRLKSQFLATISHELRTPLNAIIGFSQLIAKKGALDDRQSANLFKIEDSGRKLLRLVNDLLDISRIDVGHMEIHSEQIVLASFFEDLRRQSEPLMEANNNSLTFDVAPNIGVVESDSFRLQQILMNLIDNAAKFTHQGHVTLKAEVDSGEHVLIIVQDTGMGIPQDKLNEVFDEFYQVDGTATRAYGGTGLGLAISRRLAFLMGGEITVSSTPGAGSTFRLRLPRHGRQSASSDSTPNPELTAL